MNARMKILSVLSIYAILGTITFFATISLTRAKPLKQPADTKLVFRSLSQVEHNQMIAMSGRGVVNSSSMRMVAFDRSAEGLVRVRGIANITDSRIGMIHVWSIRVFPDRGMPTGRPLFERRYDESPLFSKPGQVHTIEFDDFVDIPLPRKQYVIELAVYSVPAQADWTLSLEPFLTAAGRIKLIAGVR